MAIAKRSRKPTIGIIITLSLLAMLVLTAMLRSERVFGWNEPLQLDDCVCSVRDVREAKALGDGALRTTGTQGTFLVVTFQVEDRAQRVSYQFRDNVMLADDQGHEDPTSIAGRAALRLEPVSLAACSAPIPMGSSCVTELVFDVPEGAKNLHLRFTYDPLGAALDALFYRHSSIRIQ